MSETRFPEQISLQDLLTNLSAELLRMASAALEIEEKVGDVIAVGLPGGERLLVALQGLDHLVQTGNELTAFIRALSQAVDSEVLLPANGLIQSIGLRSLAEALVGQASRFDAKHTDQGDVDLF